MRRIRTGTIAIAHRRPTLAALALILAALATSAPTIGAQEPPQGPPKLEAAEPEGAKPPAPEPAATSAPPAPAAVPPAEPPVYLFLEAPKSLDELWLRLARPDFVLQRGGEAKAGPAAPGKEAPGAVVESVKVRGRSGPEFAHLTAEVEATKLVEGPAWVPLRLDGRPLISVARGGKAVEVRAAPEGKGWLARLDGAKGEVGTIVAELVVPVTRADDGYSWSLPIPEAASTSLEMAFPKETTSARAREDEPLGLASGTEGIPTATAKLPPRDRIDLAWKVKGASEKGEVLLAVAGLVDVNADPFGARTRASWDVISERGEARRISFGIDPGEEITSLTLDGRDARFEVRREAAEGPQGMAQVHVDLAEPLRAGPARKLVMVTRRAARADGSLVLRGYPFVDALEQTGVLAIGCPAGAWVDATPGPGLRPIDRETELPEELRDPQATALAFQFRQPFHLALRVIEPTPRLMARLASRVQVGERSAQVDARYTFDVLSGRPDRVEFILPDGWGVETIGPPEAVEGTTVSDPQSPGSGRRAVVQLSPAARQSPSFLLKITGRVAFNDKGEGALSWPAPRGISVISGDAAVWTEPSLALAFDWTKARGLEARRWRIPENWPWQAEPGAIPGAWVRIGDPSARLDLRTTPRPRTLTWENTLRAIIEREGIAIRQRMRGRVEAGVLDQVEVLAPKGMTWAIEGSDAPARTVLGEADGIVRERLQWPRAVAGEINLTIASSLPLPKGLSAPAKLALPLIRPADGQVRSLLLTISPSADWKAQPEETRGWTPAAPLPEDESTATALAADDPQSAQPPPLSLTPLAPLSLPPVVAARLWLRTEVTPDGRLRHSARYRVVHHSGNFKVTLPEGAEVERAGIGTSAFRDVPLAQDGGDLRIALPAEVPATVLLDYSTPMPSGRPWPVPSLAEGVVQETTWDVGLARDDVLLGVPEGWSDRNHWAWRGIGWGRVPDGSREDLERWLRGEDQVVVAPPAAAPAESAPDLMTRRLVFRRPGPPAPISVAMIDRLVLLALCSLLALGLGLLALRYPGAAPMGALCLVALFFAGLTAMPNLALQLAQSSILGIALVAIAAGTQRWVMGRRRAGRFADASDLRSASASGSAPILAKPASALEGIPAEASTTIRRRTGSSVLGINPEAAGDAGSAYPPPSP